MDDTFAAALIARARNLAASFRYADAAKVLDDDEFRVFCQQSDHPDLVIVLAELAMWQAWSGQINSALAIFADLENRGFGELERNERLVIRARHAYVVGLSGGPDTSERALEMLGELVAEVDASGKVETNLGLHILRQHARWLGTTGKPQEALSKLRAIEADFQGKVPNDSEEWLLLKSNLAYFTAASDDEASTQDAIDRYTELVRAREAALGKKHPHTFDARRNRAWVLGRRNPGQALIDLGALIHDSKGVLDPAHRYIVTAHLDAAVYAAKDDSTDLVIKHLDAISRAVDVSGSVVEALTEYGSVSAPAEKLDEIAAYLSSVNEPDHAQTARDLSAALEESVVADET